MTTHAAWTVPVTIAAVAENGAHFDLSAPPAIRDQLAREADLRGVKALDASFDVTRRGDGLRVRGRVRANVDQTCVVTLEPIDTTVDEEVDISYSPTAELPAGRAGEIDISAAHAAEEPPEPMQGHAIDLAAIATEFFLLGLDPYPRKSGVNFEPPVGGDSAEDKPFAALAALKRDMK